MLASPAAIYNLQSAVYNHQRLAMSHPRRQMFLALPLIAVLLAVTLAIPRRMSASPVADFAAPMSAQEARARVSAAQQADTQRRDVLARTLGATSAASLPTMQNMFFSET